MSVNRPPAIIYFERIIFATLALGILQTYFGWANLISHFEANGNSAREAVVYHLTLYIFVFGIIIALTLFVSRGRSQIAKWISIFLFALGLPSFFLIVSRGILAGSALVSVLQTIGQMVAYGLLFNPAARRWLSKTEPIDDLKETFS